MAQPFRRLSIETDSVYCATGAAAPGENGKMREKEKKKKEPIADLLLALVFNWLAQCVLRILEGEKKWNESSQSG